MKIGVADTTFSRIDMASFVIPILKDHDVERYTVPGMKDLPVASKILLEKHNCDIVIALGMAGPQPIDKQCSHEASIGLQHAQLATNKHILEVFIHADESNDAKELFEIAKNRAEKHAYNALELLAGKDTLTKKAGSGSRQGKPDEGPLLK